jgi:hypothetical protein
VATPSPDTPGHSALRSLSEATNCEQPRARIKLGVLFCDDSRRVSIKYCCSRLCFTVSNRRFPPPITSLGQKQTFRPALAMSALPPIADIAGCDWDVRFVPKADIGVSFDDFVGTGRYCPPDFDIKRIGRAARPSLGQNASCRADCSEQAKDFLAFRFPKLSQRINRQRTNRQVAGVAAALAPLNLPSKQYL